MGRKKCFIEGCTSRQYEAGKKYSFYRIKVSDPLLYHHWITAITVGNNQKNVSNHPKGAVICSKHFMGDSFQAGFTKRLKSTAVPSIFPGSENMRDFDNPLLDTSTMKIDRNFLSTFAITERNSTLAITKIPTRKPRIHFPGDIRLGDNLKIASPKTLVKYIRILKKDRQETKKALKRLTTENLQQKQKIKKLEHLLSSLKEKKLITTDPEDVL